MEEDVIDLFSDMWTPWVRRAGQTITAAAATTVAYLKLKKAVTGWGSDTRAVDAQLPHAMDWATLLVTSLQTTVMRSVFESVAPIAKTKALLHHSAKASRERKIELWEAVRCDAIAALIVVPYCNAVVTTAAASRATIILLLHQQAAKKSTTLNPSSGLAGGLMSALSSMMVISASAFATRDIGIEAQQMSRIVASVIRGLFAAAQPLIGKHFPETFFGVTQSVTAAQIATALRQSRLDLEAFIDWKAVLDSPFDPRTRREEESDLRALLTSRNVPAASGESLSRPDPSVLESPFGDQSELESFLAELSHDDSFEKLLLSHSDQLIEPFLGTAANKESARGNVSALERAVGDAKSYNPVTKAATMLQVVLGLVSSAEKLMDEPLKQVPSLTRAFCLELLKSSSGP